MDEKYISVKTKRLSNFEALRLLSMLMVLNLHSFYGYSHGTGVLQSLDFFRNSTSICAVNAFILISGYFGIKWKTKSFYNLIFQILFYSFSVYLFCVAIGVLPYEKSQFLSCFKGLYASWGFIKNYLLLYFFSPMLNALVEKLSSKKLFAFVLIFYLAENFVFISMTLMNFIVLYLIGRFINKTEALSKLRINANGSYWLLTTMIFVLSYVIYITYHLDAEAMSTFILAYSYASPFVILQAIALFFIFGRMAFHNNIVNWCSASCLAIFLIHTHPALKNLDGIGYYSVTERLYNESLLLHISVLLLLMLFVFIGSILVDKIRLLISEMVYSLLKRVYRQLPNRLFCINNYLPQQFVDIMKNE